MRFHAAESHIDPQKIGVLGFSAGGRLVAAISTNFAKRLYPAVDAADKESSRPDSGVPLYPGHMLENTSKNFELNPYIPVTKQTPPTFLLQAEDDPIDTVKSSLVSECQTSKYMGIDFLDFLRLGEKDIRAFADSRRGRWRRSQISSTTKAYAASDNCGR